MRVLATALLLACSLLGSSRAQAQETRGVIVGRVLSRESGRPVDLATVTVMGTEIRTQSDLDGRFRLVLPPGLYSVRVLRIGNSPAQRDSLRVVAGQVLTTDFVLSSAAMQLQGVTVTAEVVRQSSEDALLLAQKAAPRVSDGISAEAIRRAPGSDASDAVVRVTGVSVMDGRFAVVRGLAERYSNTLLNGVELPSPEPLKKVVPLDLFPSSLLESIVVSKTATPDRPGDFAGGSVEVTTKEFPDRQVAEFSFATGYGSQSTFREMPLLRQRGLDYFGFDQGGRRQMPANIPAGGASMGANEAFAERMRNEWTPTPSALPPNLDASLNFGGRFGGSEAPFGYAMSLSYGRQYDATPNRLSQIVFNKETGTPDQGYVSAEASTTTDLGAIANFAYRAGTGTKFAWKNLFTRGSEEMLARSNGFETYNGTSERVTYQARFITRQLMQTQLTGDHRIGFLLNSRLEWKATSAWAQRDEPENRSLIYFRDAASGDLVLSPSNPSPFWFRFLDDQVQSVQADWALPLEPLLPAGSQFKVGGLIRQRERAFDAFQFRLFASADPNGGSAVRIEPERAFSPEVLGAFADLRRQGEGSLPYEAEDGVTASFAMVDLPLTSWMRIVTGLRREQWRLTLYQGTKASPIGEPTRRNTTDDLWSANLTFNLSDRQNLRLAAYQTVARPDPRELAPDYYIAVTGDCANQGNPNVQATRIMNGDIRWEWFPRAGELLSASLFAKRFEAPIGELLTYPGSSLCTVEYFNLDRAEILGSEIEFRKALDFLPGPLSGLAVGVNLTLVQSSSQYSPSPEYTLNYKLQGQSDVLANFSLLYTDPAQNIDASLLVNTFSDRIVRYGIANLVDGVAEQVPNVMEQGRLSIDAKVRKKVGRYTVSLSARNLADAETIYYQESDAGRTRTGYMRPGTTVSIGIGYAIR